MRFVCLAGFILLFTSCSFNYLTAIKDNDTSAPTARQCGSCHVVQYAEWKETAHAGAYTSVSFKEESDNYRDQDCLFCHAPGEILNPVQNIRQYNRDEGVTCVSCHLFKEAMQGPHDSGALFSPHAVIKNRKLDSRQESAVVCGVCHEETYEQWQEQSEKKPYPQCLVCHGAAVRRPHTKGTNIFSKVLVAFEPEHDVRSHSLVLSNHFGKGNGPDMRLTGQDGDTFSFSLVNSLPHDLPTGSFAEKELFIQFRWQDAGTAMPDGKEKFVVPLLAPGEQYDFTVTLFKRPQEAILQLSLLRIAASTGRISLIRSWFFTDFSPSSR